MANSSPNTRTSRTRQAIAILAWGCLIGIAFYLLNARQSGALVRGATALEAALLAAFSAFVGVFAWMLFNPNQNRTGDSPALFSAAAATLFPPPVIAFCLLSHESPLRWWLALGIFMLVVIAVLSHVPDEFFGVPRGRSSYIVPLPVFDQVENSVMDPNASWFTFNDLSEIVPDKERPSLAPRAYLNRESPQRSSSTSAAFPNVRPVSEVDDILGTDFDLGLLDDSMLEFDLSESTVEPIAKRQPPEARSGSRRQKKAVTNKGVTDSTSSAFRRAPSSLDYQTTLTESRYHMQSARSRKLARRLPSALNRPDRRTRLASSLRPAQPEEVSPVAEFSDASQGTNSPIRQSDPLDTTPLRQRDIRKEQKLRQSAVDVPEKTQERPRKRRRDSEPTEAPRGKNLRADKTPAEEPDTIVHAPPKSSSGGSILGIPIPLGQKQSTSNAINVQESAADSHKRSRNVESGGKGKPSSTLQSVGSQAERSSDNRAVTKTRASTPSPADLERTQDDHGGELVEGVRTIRFDKGQKRANLHIPFSPPLAGMPEVECECVDDVPLRLKIPVRQSYGIRIEARRSDASEPIEADIGFAAVFSPE